MSKRRVFVLVASLIAAVLVFGLSLSAERSRDFSDITASAVWGA